VAEGLSNKEIPDKLYLGEGTVRNYIGFLPEKLSRRTARNWLFSITNMCEN